MKLWTILVVAICLTGCTTEKDTGLSKNDFAMEMAQATCNWLFHCCDGSEREDLGKGNWSQYWQDVSTEAVCASKLSTKYFDQFRDAQASAWSTGAARSCIDGILESATSCPRSFDPDSALTQCNLVTATKSPGDMCQNTWECTTKFCKSGVCANPLKEGSTCSEKEPCTGGTRCLSGTCSALQPDNASCKQGLECISGACGGGKCVVSTTFTCDGK
jgi:hypothetical protein